MADKQDLLLTPDTRADLVDSVIGLHPNMDTELQNTLINLVDLVAQTQLAKAEKYYHPSIEAQKVKMVKEDE